MLFEEFRKHFHNLVKDLRELLDRPAEVTSRPELVSLPNSAPAVVIVFEITPGPWLDRRAATELALINKRTEERLRHTGHWQTFYRHTRSCPAEGSTLDQCMCRWLVAECHPISDAQADELRADHSLYDSMTVIETETP